MKKQSFDLIVLYLAQAVSLYFCTFGLPTILRSEGVSLEKIGLFSILLLPWVIKFLWAPFVDRKYIHKIGRRKSWFLTMQFFTILLFLIFFIYNPKDYTNYIFLFAFVLSTIAATQDIAVDGFSIEQTKAKNLQWSNFYRVIGTTLGSTVGGAALIALYNILGWHEITLYLAILSIGICLYMFFIKEKNENVQYQHSIPSIKSFFKRQETRTLLIICLSYRACEGLVMGMQSAFLVDSHIPLSTIGMVMGTGSAIIGIFGAAIISYLFKFYKETALLTLLAIIRGFCYFSLGFIGFSGIDNSTIIFSIVLLNMASRLMEMIVLYTIFMKFSSKNQAGTDFTILICFELLIYILGMSVSGFLAANIGYSMLFTLGGAISIPGFLIAYFFLKKLSYKRP
ncbi:MFS transporter [Allofrancisella guangzhouensis]|uniref:Transporter n=1 Tax=Allofrancisella guangzhouensis TaxID=594679 RepID=A0A0A8E3F4_9GAMM|nr:MFS transporter [Allofrancisella guangzhouensis]AJC48484.1 transporter [Allofrancisella guangzhouensis]MBK2027612.1 MFS transporter [Allofrancisella guangzhouensis]MBK2044075.1 MFS transporter [Allofrancisella guangzhouensis]MBK2046523.1 MFS transporter [Allofrancisella guangzhouensis]